jgi:putative PIN family toxin of toxin-antitoxin system
MNPIQIVIDTNVIVSASRSQAGASYELLRRIGDPRWQFNVSTALVLEYESVLKREFHRQEKSTDVVDRFLNDLVSHANRRGIFFQWRPVLPDPSDDFVLELAFASGAKYIVTYNLKHFVGAAALGVSAISPSEFLKLKEVVR